MTSSHRCGFPAQSSPQSSMLMSSLLEEIYSDAPSGTGGGRTSAPPTAIICHLLPSSVSGEMVRMSQLSERNLPDLDECGLNELHDIHNRLQNEVLLASRNLVRELHCREHLQSKLDRKCHRINQFIKKLGLLQRFINQRIVGLHEGTPAAVDEWIACGRRISKYVRQELDAGLSFAQLTCSDDSEHSSESNNLNVPTGGADVCVNLFDPMRRRRISIKPSLTPGAGTRRTVRRRKPNDPGFSIVPRSNCEESFQQWRDAMRAMARLSTGIPSQFRRRVWLTLADRQITSQHINWSRLVRVVFNEQMNPDDDHLGRQIVKDLHRTGCDQIGSDDDRAALKRVLLAYARWNKRVGYCQGFNILAAVILNVMERDEKEAFKVMVYLIDFILPESFFAQNLQALSVDVAVFRDLLRLKQPRLAAHLQELQQNAAKEADDALGLSAPLAKRTYEPPLTNLYAIQWFLTLFATCLPTDCVHRVWDSILLEGSEIGLRAGLIIMDVLHDNLMKITSADKFYSTMSHWMEEFSEGRHITTVDFLQRIYDLGPFPWPELKERRDKYAFNINPFGEDSQSFEELTGDRTKSRWWKKKSNFKVTSSAIAKAITKSDQQASDLPSVLADEERIEVNNATESLKVAESQINRHQCITQPEGRQSTADFFIEIDLSDDNWDGAKSLRASSSNLSNRKIRSGTVHKRFLSESEPHRTSSLHRKKSLSCGYNQGGEPFADKQKILIRTTATHQNSDDDDDDDESDEGIRRKNKGAGVRRLSLKNVQPTITPDISELGPGAVSLVPTAPRLSDLESTRQKQAFVNLPQLEAAYNRQRMRRMAIDLNVLRSTPSDDSQLLENMSLGSMVLAPPMQAEKQRIADTQQSTYERRNLSSLHANNVPTNVTYVPSQVSELPLAHDPDLLVTQSSYLAAKSSSDRFRSFISHRPQEQNEPGRNHQKPTVSKLFSFDDSVFQTIQEWERRNAALTSESPMDVEHGFSSSSSSSLEKDDAHVEAAKTSAEAQVSPQTLLSLAIKQRLSDSQLKNVQPDSNVSSLQALIVKALQRDRLKVDHNISSPPPVSTVSPSSPPQASSPVAMLHRPPWAAALVSIGSSRGAAASRSQCSVSSDFQSQISPKFYSNRRLFGEKFGLYKPGT